MNGSKQKNKTLNDVHHAVTDEAGIKKNPASLYINYNVTSTGIQRFISAQYCMHSVSVCTEQRKLRATAMPMNCLVILGDKC